MEVDSFFTTPRWEILKIISEKPSSPLEISDKLKTTVSYVSQQLKLLEAAGLVKKEKTGEVEKGKPRNVYSISKEIAHITSLSNDFSIKKTINLDNFKKIIIKTLCLDRPHLECILYKIIFSNFLDDILLIFVDNSLPEKICIYTENKKTKEKIISLFSDEKYLNLITDTKQLEKINLSSGIILLDKLNKNFSLKGGENA